MKSNDNAESGEAVRYGAWLADSPTRSHVLAFAERMEAKLAKNRHKGDRNGWPKDDALSLYDRLDQKSCELRAALKDPDATREQIANEAADVANFAMMVADVVLTRKSANDPSSATAWLRSKAGDVSDRRDNPKR